MKLKIKSYPSIEEKIHANLTINIKKINENLFIRPINVDLEIVKKLFDFIEENKQNAFMGTGEWEWIEKNLRHQYFDSLKKKTRKIS